MDKNKICAAMYSTVNKLEKLQEMINFSINRLKIIGMGTAINHLEESLIQIELAKESLQRNIKERM